MRTTVEVRSNIDFRAIRKGMHEGAIKGLSDAVEHLLTEANKRVPHDEGTLERSGAASVDAQSMTGAVSYDTPYAPRQHEEMNYQHDGKGEAKWLETTFSEQADTVGKIIAAAIIGEGLVHYTNARGQTKLVTQAQASNWNSLKKG